MQQHCINIATTLQQHCNNIATTLQQHCNNTFTKIAVSKTPLLSLWWPLWCILTNNDAMIMTSCSFSFCHFKMHFQLGMKADHNTVSIILSPNILECVKVYWFLLLWGDTYNTCHLSPDFTLHFDHSCCFQEINCQTNWLYNSSYSGFFFVPFSNVCVEESSRFDIFMSSIQSWSNNLFYWYPNFKV